MSSSGNGLLKRPPPLQIAPNSPHSAHSASISSTLSSTAATSRSATPGSPEEPRRRHGSAPSTSTLVFPRRESAPVSTSTANALASRRFSTAESAPRKGSDFGIVHKPSPLSPKRKPLPKGSAFEKPDTSPEEELDGKLGKLDLAGGSTMVRAPLDNYG